MKKTLVSFVLVIAAVAVAQQPTSQQPTSSTAPMKRDGTRLVLKLAGQRIRRFVSFLIMDFRFWMDPTHTDIETPESWCS